MIVDYRNLDVVKFLGQNEALEEGNPIYFEADNRAKECALIPYKTNAVQKDKIVHQTVKKGLFGKKVEEKKIPTTVYEAIPESKGFGFISFSNHNITKNNCSLSYYRDGWRSKTVTIDPELLMPALTTQPVTIEDAILLVKTDPRFFKQIDPTICKSKDDLKSLCSAAVEGLDAILDYQKALGVVVTSEEIAERERFSDACKECGFDFLNRYKKLASKKTDFKQIFFNV